MREYDVNVYMQSDAIPRSLARCGPQSYHGLSVAAQTRETFLHSPRQVPAMSSVSGIGNSAAAQSSDLSQASDNPVSQATRFGLARVENARDVAQGEAGTAAAAESIAADAAARASAGTVSPLAGAAKDKAEAIKTEVDTAKNAFSVARDSASRAQAAAAYATQEAESVANGADNDPNVTAQLKTMTDEANQAANQASASLSRAEQSLNKVNAAAEAAMRAIRTDI